MASERYRVSLVRGTAGALVEVRGALELPAVAGTTLLPLGPNERLVRGALEHEHAIHAELESALGGRGAATVVSDAFVSFVVEGEDAQALLAQGCPLDFSTLGACARSVLARAGVIVLRRAGGFEIFVERSHGAYAWHWLERAAQGRR